MVQHDEDQDLLVEEAKKLGRFQPIVSNNRGAAGAFTSPEIDEGLLRYARDDPHQALQAAHVTAVCFELRKVSLNTQQALRQLALNVQNGVNSCTAQRSQTCSFVG